MGFVGVSPGEDSIVSGHVEEKKQHLRQVLLLWRHGRVFVGAKFIEIACGASDQNHLNLSGGQTVSAVATGDRYLGKATTKGSRFAEKWATGLM